LRLFHREGNKMKKGLFLLSFIVLLIAGNSCRKPKHYPDEPIITFKEFFTTKNSQGLDEKAIFIISFTDGNGDIGFRPGDTLSPFDTCSIYQFNYFIKIFEKRDGTFRQFVFKKNFAPCMLVDLYNVCNPVFSETLDSTYNARLKDITPNGKSKVLSGDLSFEMPFLIPCVTNDTVKFQIYIYDRDLHRSNVLETPEYIISTM
jgi:hypothetical protein